MPLDDNLPGALEGRRAELAAVDAQSGGVFENVFFIDTSGVGESVAQVKFNVRFVSMPALSASWSMFENQRLTKGSYPQVSVGVYVWNFGKRPDTNARYYDGATLSISVFNGDIGDGTDGSGVKLKHHLTFKGRALRNPAGL